MALDVTLAIIGGLLVLSGIAGCLFPVLPGPILGYAGLLVLQFSSTHPFTSQFLVVFALLTVLAGVLDYVIPIYGTKTLEGSKYGIWGCTAGLIAGTIFFFPLGIIIGPAAGAFAGELLSGKSGSKAMKSAIGSFIGFLASTALKLALTASMGYYFIVTSYNLFLAR